MAWGSICRSAAAPGASSCGSRRPARRELVRVERFLLCNSGSLRPWRRRRSWTSHLPLPCRSRLPAQGEEAGKGVVRGGWPPSSLAAQGEEAVQGVDGAAQGKETAGWSKNCSVELVRRAVLWGSEPQVSAGAQPHLFASGSERSAGEHSA